MTQWKSFNTPPKEGEQVVALTRGMRTLLILDFYASETYTDCVGWMPAEVILDAPLGYDPKFGDEKLCLCGHEYRRHFDPFEDYYPVGCKYCHAYPEGVEHRKESLPPEELRMESEFEHYIDKYASVCSGFKLDPNPNNTGCFRCDKIEGRKECLCPPKPVPVDTSTQHP
jgi:hypothetical protein